MNIRQGIVEAANALGISPHDLATVISYETGGTFNPTQPGPTTKWGQHRGYIQFGEDQARRYGVDFSSPESAMATQLGANGGVVRYLRDTGVKPGMGLLDVYSAVNAGGVGRYNASDTAAGGAAGNVRQKVAGMGGHQDKATALLGGSYTPSTTPSTSIASAFDNTVAPPSPIYPDLQQPAYAADSFSSPVGRRISGDQRRSDTPTGAVDGGSDPSESVLDFASATPEVLQQPQQPQPAIEQSPVGGLAELFKVRDIGQAGAIDPITQQPVLRRSRRTYG